MVRGRCCMHACTTPNAMQAPCIHACMHAPSTTHLRRVHRPARHQQRRRGVGGVQDEQQALVQRDARRQRRRGARLRLAVLLAQTGLQLSGLVGDWSVQLGPFLPSN